MPRAIRIAALAAALAAVRCAGATPSTDALDAQTEPDTALPACPQSGVVFGLGVDHQPIDLTPGDKLPVTQGFQGFLFVRVGLRSAERLPDVVHTKVHVVLDNGLDTWVPARPLATGPWQAGSQTSDVPVYFNSTPLPELLARKASIDVISSTGKCEIRAHVDTVLSIGGFMAADAAFWSDAGYAN